MNRWATWVVAGAASLGCGHSERDFGAGIAGGGAGGVLAHAGAAARAGSTSKNGGANSLDGGSGNSPNGGSNSPTGGSGDAPNGGGNSLNGGGGNLPNGGSGGAPNSGAGSSAGGATGMAGSPPITAGAAGSGQPLTCASGLKACAGACVAIDDPKYGCGATTCNSSTCPAAGTATLACQAGACVIGTCGSGTKKCAGKCVAVNDPTYGCGATSCDASACPQVGTGTLVCSGTACVAGSCGSGTKICDNKCVPVDANRGCADPLSCIACSANEVCAGSPVTKCQCVPDNVEACKGKACGSAVNNCGTTVQCTNTCAAPNTCGGGGVGPNACGCTATDPCSGKACGSATNNCNQVVACVNTCSGSLPACSGNTCYECNTAADCPSVGVNPCAKATCSTNHTCSITTAPSGTSCVAGTCSTTAVGICTRPQVAAGGFSIDPTEVTRGQYLAFLQAKQGNVSGQPGTCSWNTSYSPSGGWPPTVAEYDMPVAWVDWCDAYAYCAWSGRRLCGKIGGGPNGLDDYDDPALSQWMHACVGASTTSYPYGNSYVASKCNGTTSQSAAVASYAQCVGGYAGIYDLSGNLWEWEDSCLTETGATDLCRERGGSYYSNDAVGLHLQCAANNNNPRQATDSTIGFRCCGP